MFWERLSPQSSSSVRPKRSETSSWIRLIETSAASPCGKTSLRTSCGELDRHRPAGERGERDDADERALELADVRRDAAGDEREHLRRRARGCRPSSTFLRRIAMRVSRSGGWMSVMRPHSNRERSRSSSVAMLARRPVGGHDDLLAGLVERVEGVEELLLGPLLVLEELDVVDRAARRRAVALLEALDALVAQRVDELVRERLARHVADARGRASAR